MLLAATAVAFSPVFLRLHLHNPGGGPLEGKDLLLGREQSQALGRLLQKRRQKQVKEVDNKKRKSADSMLRY